MRANARGDVGRLLLAVLLKAPGEIARAIGWLDPLSTDAAKPSTEPSVPEKAITSVVSLALCKRANFEGDRLHITDRL